MKGTLIVVWGWYGAFALLGAYALTTFKIIDPYSWTYQLLNLTGAAGIVAVSLYKKNYPPAILNAAWTAIALVTVIILLMR